MERGISAFATHDGISPDELARLVEQRGHGWLHFADHTHIPASRETPFPGGEPLARKYSHIYDLFVALTAAAVATTSLRVGSGLCLIVQRDPIITAKQVASIDHLSGGRFELAVGAGWNREEMANHGTDPRARFKVMEERVEAMKAIWTQDEASYHGDHVSFDRIWSWPKPVQRPHPPVLVGGVGPTVFDRVLAYGDGWYPLLHPQLLDRTRELRRRAEELERRLQIVVTGIRPSPELLEEYAAAGVDRYMFEVPAAHSGPVEKELDAIERTWAEAFGRT